MSAQFTSQSQVASTTARSLERTAYLKAHRAVVEDAIGAYFEAEPQGEQVTLAVLRALQPHIVPARKSVPHTLKQDIGLYVVIVLCQLVGAENVETYRDEDTGRGSARTVSMAWSDLHGFVSRYTPHRLTTKGLRALPARSRRTRRS